MRIILQQTNECPSASPPTQKTTEANLALVSALTTSACPGFCLSPDTSTASIHPPVSVWSQSQVLALTAIVLLCLPAHTPANSMSTRMAMEVLHTSHSFTQFFCFFVALRSATIPPESSTRLSDTAVFCFVFECFLLSTLEAVPQAHLA